MRKFIIFIMLLPALFPCFGMAEKEKEQKKVNMTYTQITQEEAKKIIDEKTGYIILDVREQYEFDAGHIPNAVLLPYTQTEQLASVMLKDKQQMILVYCRSGRRSKISAQILADMGYSNVYEFGGIITWQYEIVK